MATYYVKTDGSDAYTGTSDSSAWQTIAKVNATAFQAGDSILFNRGDEWREMILNTTYSNLRYGAYGTGDKPIINGANIVTGWSNDSGNIWYANCPVITDYGFIYDYVVVVNGTLYTQVATKVDVSTANTYYIDKTPDPDVAYIYSTTDPDTKTVEITARICGIAVQDRTHIIIENINFKNAGFSGVLLRASVAQIDGSSLIDHCDFYNNRQSGTYFDHGYSNSRVQYCYAYNNGNGFYSWGDASVNYGSDSNVFSHCYSSHSINYSGDGIVASDGHGFGIYDSNNNIVEYCESEGDMFGMQIDCANNVRNVIYRYNYVHDTPYFSPGIGIGSNGSTGSVHQAYYNIVVNTGLGDPYGGEGYGIVIGGNGDREVYVYNNTVYQDNSHNGIGIGCAGGTQPGKNVHIKNNLVYSNNTAAGMISLGATATTGFELNNNMYYAPLDSTNIFFYAGSFYNTLADWQTAISQDSSSMYGDPKFISVGSDFQLQADSSAINAGVDVGLTTDYAGHTIQGIPDIGAYEYYDSNLVPKHLKYAGRYIGYNNKYIIYYVNA